MTDDERAWFKLCRDLSHALRCAAGDLNELAYTLEEQAKQKSYRIRQRTDDQANAETVETVRVMDE